MSIESKGSKGAPKSYEKKVFQGIETEKGKSVKRERGGSRATQGTKASDSTGTKGIKTSDNTGKSDLQKMKDAQAKKDAAAIAKVRARIKQM